MPTTTLNKSTVRQFAVAATLIVLLVIAHLAPMWSVPRFPSQDGPEHAYNATILHDYGRPGSEALSRYFVISHRPVPNWTTHLILDALLNIVSPATADKLVISGYIVLFFLASHYAVRAADRAALWPLLLLVPFAYNVFLFYGFYNFDYSLPALIIVVGYWLRNADQFGGPRIAVLGVLASILYFCHIISFGIAGILIVVGVLQEIFGLAATGRMLFVAVVLAFIAALRAFAGPKIGAAALVIAVLIAVAFTLKRLLNIAWPMNHRRVVAAAAPLLAVVPPTIFTIAFIAHEPSYSRGEPGVTRLARLVDWSFAFHGWDRLASVGVMLILAAATGPVLAYKIRQKTWQRADAVLIAAILTVALTMVIPTALSGGTFIVDRTGMLAALMWGLWVAVQLGVPSQNFIRPIGKIAVLSAAAMIALALLARDTMGIIDRARCVDELVAIAAANIPQGALAMSAVYDEGDPPGSNFSPRLKAMLHAIGWVAADKKAVDVINYEAGIGYFPILFRPDYQFDVATATNVPPSDYVKATHGRGRIDYIVLWTGGQPPRSSIDRRFAAQLAADYHEIAQSQGLGWAHVYARNGVLPPAPQ